MAKRTTTTAVTTTIEEESVSSTPVSIEVPVTNGAFDMLNSFIVYQPLEDGQKISVRLDSIIARQNPKYNPASENKADHIQGYVDFNWVALSDNRPIKDSRQFPLGVSILVNQLIEQNPFLPVNVALPVLTQHIISERTTFDAWISINPTDQGTFRNLLFVEPKRREVAEETATVNDGI